MYGPRQIFGLEKAPNKRNCKKMHAAEIPILLIIFFITRKIILGKELDADNT